MKVCDWCKRTSKEPECEIETVHIGCDIGVLKVGEKRIETTAELCTSCIRKVNQEVNYLVVRLFDIKITN